MKNNLLLTTALVALAMPAWASGYDSIISKSNNTGNTNGGVYWVTGGESLSVESTTFQNNVAGSIGGALGLGTGGNTLTVKNSKFLNNHAINDGGAIGAYRNLSIVDSVFDGNTAQLGGSNYTEEVTDDTAIGGGAISLGSVSDTTITSISNSIFKNNKSGKNGGAIGTRMGKDGDNSAAKLSIEATFKNNEAHNNGGAIYNTFYAGGVNVKGIFEENTAGNNGGAIYNDGAKDKAGNNGGVMSIADSTFKDNSSVNFGGAIFDKGELSISNSTFEGNESYSNGAITNFGRLTTVTDSTFTSNTAEADGGAVGIYKTANISDSVFTSNTAGTASDANGGGAIFVGQTGNATLTRVKFYSNTSGAHGGAIAARHFNGQGYLDIDTATFDGNQAAAEGGAIASIYNGTIDIADSTFTNNTAGTNGGAIYVGKATNYGGGAGTQSTNGGVLNLTGTNVFSGNTANGKANDIYNSGTINVSGELTLDGGIAGDGIVNFSNATLNATDGTTVIANKATFASSTLNLTVAAGATTVDLDKLFTNEVNTDAAATKYESNGLTLKNSMYTFTQDADELNNGNGSLYKVEQLSTSEIAENLGASTSETEVLMSAISGSSNNQYFNDVANTLSAAAQSGDASAVKEAQKLGADANPIVSSQETGTHEVLFGVVNNELNGDNGAMAGMSSGDVFKKASAWIRGLFNKADHEATSKSSGFNADTYGVAMGVDKEVNSNTRLGFGYANSQTDIESDGRDTDVETNSLFLYSQYKPANWYVNTVLAYSWSEYDEAKSVMSSSVDTKYDVDTIALQSMYGYETKFKGHDLTPEFGFRYLHISQDAYTDRLGDTVGENTEDVLTLVAGAKIAKNYQLDNGAVLRPELKAAVTYDLFDADNSANVTLANGANYVVDGEKLNRLGFEFGAKVTTKAADKLEVSAGYLTRVREDYQDHTITLDARYNF